MQERGDRAQRRDRTVTWVIGSFLVFLLSACGAAPGRVMAPPAPAPAPVPTPVPPPPPSPPPAPAEPGGFGLIGTGKGGGGSGSGTIGLGNIGTLGKGAGSGTGSGYGSGAGGKGPARPARKAAATLHRYPTLLAPDQVREGETFALELSLTEAKVVHDVAVKAGKASADGKLELTLDASPAPWTIDVAVLAPGCEVVGSNLGQLELPEAGDSTPAMIQLRPKEGTAGQKLEVFATFWFKGRFLAKVAKPLTVRGAHSPVRGPVAGKPPKARRGDAAAMGDSDGNGPPGPVADLTVWMVEGTDPTRPDEAQVLIQSPHLQPQAGTHRMPADLAGQLDRHYAQFAGLVPRGAEGLAEPSTETAVTPAEQVHAFGRQLYQTATPELFKQALQTLEEQLGGKLQRIQIYTNSPRLPWELLVTDAFAADARSFLGTRYQVARWHVSSQTKVLMRPPPRVELSGVYVVAPAYKGSAALPAQQAELTAIQEASGDLYKPVAGTLAGVRSLATGKAAPSIVHFSGHGSASNHKQSSAPEFVLRLADQSLALSQWRKLAATWGGAHPLVFFNACELGRAERTGSTVDGWGPAVLESGASGYIGGLWPLGDAAASEAAASFYDSVVDGVPVAEALRLIRQKAAKSGDPTYLAYVYYGDTALTLRTPQPAQSGATIRIPDTLQVKGPLSPDVVRRIVLRHMSRLRYCLERELQHQPDLAGRAVLDIAVLPTGVVASVVVRQDTISRPEVTQCWVAQLRRTQFPTAQGLSLIALPLVVPPLQ